MSRSLEHYLERHVDWSLATFGPGTRTEGLLKHIAKELGEISRQPYDLVEWIDVIILALDGYWRHGGDPKQIMTVLVEKQDINLAREWNTPIDGEPTEHVC